MRLNKFISHNTKYSRREADQLIFDGKVNINNKKVTNPAIEVKDDDRVFVNSSLVKVSDLYTVIVYHKPRGELVTKKDDRERKTIYHSLPSKYRHFMPIGRLDFESEGLLLLTDNVEVASILMSSKLERIYNIKLRGDITNKMLEAMQNGLDIENSLKGAHDLSTISNMRIEPFIAFRILKNQKNYSKIRVAISEGKNRELRRFFAYFDREVVDLKRVAFGGIELNNLPVGKCRFLEKREYSDLRGFLKEYHKEAKNPDKDS